jgi:lipopolysaccharide assembly protein A
MQFLKTLFWVVLTVILVLWAKANWFNVPLKLWGGLIADVKLPVLLFVFFFIGFLPTLVVHRARIWSLKRRLEPATVVSVPAAPVVPPTTVSPAPAAPVAEERVATDSKAWPAP